MKQIVFISFLLAVLLLSGCNMPAGPTGNTGTNGTTGNSGGVIVDNSQIVENGDTIKVEYKGTFESGEEFDSSARSGNPLEFVAGAGQMIKGFDAAVIGMRLDEEKTITLQPDEAYGYPDPQRIVVIKKENIADFNGLEVGMYVNSPEAGKGLIVEIKEEGALVDFNNPMAGKALIFWIKVVGIQKQ